MVAPMIDQCSGQARFCAFAFEPRVLGVVLGAGRLGFRSADSCTSCKLPQAIAEHAASSTRPRAWPRPRRKHWRPAPSSTVSAGGRECKGSAAPMPIGVCHPAAAAACSLPLAACRARPPTPPAAARPADALVACFKTCSVCSAFTGCCTEEHKTFWVCYTQERVCGAGGAPPPFFALLPLPAGRFWIRALNPAVTAAGHQPDAHQQLAGWHLWRWRRQQHCSVTSTSRAAAAAAGRGAAAAGRRAAARASQAAHLVAAWVATLSRDEPQP